MHMLAKVKSYIEKQNLPLPPAKLIVGVSGGADSVVLLHLLCRLGYQCVVAHCNFHLRGDESLRDENFVEGLCKAEGVPFIKIDFDTEAYATQHHLSIEMAARELRYEWFEQVRLQQSAEAIAVGHHADDVAETFLMNITRGTGLKGLTGIKARNGYIIRPLLDCSREEIESYAQTERIAFVHDSSNSEQNYTRNKFRHGILPMLKEINPSFLETMKQNIALLNEAEELYRLKIDEIKTDVYSETQGKISIDLQKLNSYPAVTSILYELLAPLHFSSVVVREIAESLFSQSGKQFFSSTHRAVKDRNSLIVNELSETATDVYYIEKGQCEVQQPCRLKLEELQTLPVTEINKGKNFAYIDADLLEYPLCIRRWEKGDVFYPFGMNKKKKLSDFFIDNKFSLLKKEQTYLLLSGENVVWIIGERLDNRFKITSQTKKVLKIEVF